MPRRYSARMSELRRDLLGAAQDLDTLYPLPPTPELAHPVQVNAARAASGLQPVPPAPRSVSIEAHLLGPEHLGRMVEVTAPSEFIDRGRTRDAGPLAGRLVGYAQAPRNVGPGTGTPVRSLELTIQQGPQVRTAIVTWADHVKIAL